MRNTCEIIHLLTDSNPIQVIVDAIINRCSAASHAVPPLLLPAVLLLPSKPTLLACGYVANGCLRVLDLLHQQLLACP